MGDCGANLLGLLMGCLTVEGAVKTQVVLSFVLPLILLAVPFLDTTFVVLKRLKYRRPIYASDSEHFHHRMARIGFSRRRTIAYLYAWTLMLAGFALALRFVPYSDHKGHLYLGWTLVMAAIALARGGRECLPRLRAGDPQVPPPRRRFACAGCGPRPPRRRSSATSARTSRPANTRPSPREDASALARVLAARAGACPPRGRARAGRRDWRAAALHVHRPPLPGARHPLRAPLIGWNALQSHAQSQGLPAWLRAARADGVQPLISFEHSWIAGATGGCRARPSSRASSGRCTPATRGSKNSRPGTRPTTAGSRPATAPRSLPPTTADAPGLPRPAPCSPPNCSTCRAWSAGLRSSRARSHHEPRSGACTTTSAPTASNRLHAGAAGSHRRAGLVHRDRGVVASHNHSPSTPSPNRPAHAAAVTALHLRPPRPALRARGARVPLPVARRHPPPRALGLRADRARTGAPTRLLGARARAPHVLGQLPATPAAKALLAAARA